jgi:hypothetical protein
LFFPICLAVRRLRSQIVSREFPGGSILGNAQPNGFRIVDDALTYWVELDGTTQTQRE